MVGSLLNQMNDPFARFESEQSLVDFTHFDGTKAFDTMGFADSEGAVSGRAGTQEVDGDKLDNLELQREKREKRDKTNELIELGYQLRQSRTESVTVGGISLSIGEWQNIKDTLDDPAKLALLKEQMRAQGKTEAEIDESIDVAKMASNIALKKHSGEALSSEEQAFADSLESDPAAQQQFDSVAENVAAMSSSRLENDLSASEGQNADVSNLVTSEAREVFAVSMVQDSESIEIAEASREAVSFGNEDPFASAYTPSADFNASASGVERVAAAPATTTELAVAPAGLAHG